jgi:signal transduction histidine kinase
MNRHSGHPKKNMDIHPSNGELEPFEAISLVAHELKNPLASIRGYTELLLAGSVGEINPNQTKFLNTILANIYRMSELLGDLNDTARIDSGSERLEMTTIAPMEVIDQVVDSLLPQLEEKGLLLCTDIPEDLPTILVDRSRTVQILTNLVGNAAKYTLPGGKITVIVQPQADKVQFAIQDNGIGIKKEDQEYIFQRYYRTEDVHARDIPGTGLGLYICKKLVEMQGGEIWFESEYGKGTTFYFTARIQPVT